MSSSPTFHKAVCMCIPRIDAFKEKTALRLSESGMKAISRIRQLCLKQCFIILHAAAPIWCVIFLPWRVHHAYYCLLFWETPHCTVCRVNCRGFTKRLCPPGPAPQQLWLIKWILSTREKLVLCSLSTLNPKLLSCPRGANVQLPNANSVRTYRHYFPSEKCQMDGDFLLYEFTRILTVQCEKYSVLVWEVGHNNENGCLKTKVKPHFISGRSSETAKDSVQCTLTIIVIHFLCPNDLDTVLYANLICLQLFVGLL